MWLPSCSRSWRAEAPRQSGSRVVRERAVVLSSPIAWDIVLSLAAIPS